MVFKSLHVLIIISIALVYCIYSIIYFDDSSIRLLISNDNHRRLFELKFLSDIAPQIAKPSKEVTSTRTGEKPIEFLSKDVTDQHLRKQPTKEKNRNGNKDSGMLHFLDEKEAASQQKTTEVVQSSTPSKSLMTGSNEKDEVELHKLSVISEHPFISPRRGSDINPQHHMSLLLCPNQSKCIVPELQLQKKMRIYFCNHPTSSGVRFYFLAREGLLLHPNVEMVSYDEANEADYIMYLPGSAPWHLTECKNASFAKKLIVLDEFDGHTLVTPTITPEEYIQAYGGRSQPWYFMYFKRSFVTRRDGIFKRFPHLSQREVYPMTYAIAEAYIPTHFNIKREIEILCTLRGHKAMSTRLRTQHWVAEYGNSRKITNIISGEVNTASRKTVSMQYFQQMFNAQIIVTVNPANWEGDFRLWESMCTGALIFVDPIFVPHQYPLQDGKHVVFFSNTNRTELFEKLDYYRNPAHQEEARRIAVNGYLFAMKYHRTVNLMDYIMRTVHTKEVQDQNLPLPSYQYTGQYLNYEARSQEDMIIKCHKPGNYTLATLESPSNAGSQLNSNTIKPVRRTCSESEQLKVKKAIQEFQQQQEAERAAEAAAEEAKAAQAAAVAAGKVLVIPDDSAEQSAIHPVTGEVDVTKLPPPTPGFARNINFSRRRL